MWTVDPAFSFGMCHRLECSEGFFVYFIFSLNVWKGGSQAGFGFHFSTSSLSSLNIFIDYDLELAVFLRMHVLLRGFLGSPIHSSEHVSRILPS